MTEPRSSGASLVAGSVYREQAAAAIRDVPTAKDSAPLLLFVRLAAFLAVLAGCGVLGLAAFGRFIPVMDIASHAAFHAVGAIVGGLTALLLAQCGHAWRACAGLATIAVATVLTPVAIASMSEMDRAALIAARPAGMLRLVSLNTWHANQNLEEVVAFLEEARADVVVLVEFGPGKRRWLKRLKATYPHQAGCSQNIFCSVQFLSRHPFEGFSTFSRDWAPGPPRVEVTFGSKFQGLTLIGVHLMRPIDSYLGNYREVNLVAERVRSVRERRRGPVIVAGDFNLTAWSSNWSVFRKRSGLKHMGRFLPSWPSQPRGLPQLAIDHVFASNDVTFHNVALGPDVGSDHRAIIADFKLSN